MSQKKVDAYKAEKANREENYEKGEDWSLLLRSWQRLLRVWLLYVDWLFCLRKVTEGQETVTTETVMDTSALDSYLNGLSADSEAE